MSNNLERVQYALDLLNSFEEIRKKSIVCDFLIIAGEEEFPVHRAVLAASSEYFRALFQSGMKETTQGFVEMKGMDAIIIKLVVSYIYTGDAKLSNELAVNALEAADYLQLDGLVSMCWRFLQNNMSAENCILTIQFPRLYNRYDVLEDYVEKYLVEHLAKVSSTESFLTISKAGIVCHIANSKDFPEVLWQATMYWTSTLQENRDEVMVELLMTLRNKHFPFQLLVKKIETEDLLRISTSVRNCVLGRKDVRDSAAAGGVARKFNIAILDWRRPAYGTIRLFNLAKSSFSDFTRPDDNLRIDWDNCAIVCCGDVMYILVQEILFQLDQEGEWINRASMPRRAGDQPKMASLEGDIYVLGPRSFIACYHPLSNDWSIDLPGCGANFGFCTASFGNSLYVLGGNEHGNFTNDVECYDPSRRNWSRKQPMMEKRSWASAAVLRESIVVAGGYDGGRTLNSVECYSQITAAWSQITNMKSCRENFTLLCICDKLYACGGDVVNRSRRFKEEGTIEVYDEKEERWITLTENQCLAKYSLACEYFFTSKLKKQKADLLCACS